ncbi:hypothetical protein GWO43_27320 [candidate division KSB1 bacterium]|nr:hypothetical protein [candidate division KSB1 bacterium]NIR70494.1 hypothetical protein [candidate division KSB1 bacterium]NIS27669.1 hypothetical protein [candidate division KSB1 bacterium]NIT74504.1 hypothetical protein [candidate division KSB1 bacterium]NIU23743.1 hypothetical protein [candidate division KSB1 bacterium]
MKSANKFFFLCPGILLLLTAGFLIAAHSVVFDRLLLLIQRNLSPDQNLSSFTQWRFDWFLYYLAAVCGMFGTVFLICKNPDFRNKIVRMFQTNGSRRLSPNIHNPIFQLLFSTVLGIALTVLFILFYTRRAEFLIPLFVEDGVFETLSAIVFAFAAYLFGKTFVTSKRTDWLSSSNANWIRWLFAGLTLIFFFVAMEEISWGQRILGWQTPSFLSSANQQGETSVHNIESLSLVFDLLYILPAFVLPIVMVATFIFHLQKRTKFWLNLLLPYPSLSPLAFLLGAVALTMQGELFEELTALFALLYALRVEKTVSRFASQRV